MRTGLQFRLAFLLLIASTGCASSPLRPFQWLRHRSSSQSAQTVPDSAEEIGDSLSVAPAKLPPGIELPPEPTARPQTLPSGATETPENHAKGVIFASAE